MVRKLLRGRFANTAFCILAPNGKTQLTRAGRSPAMGLGLGRGGHDSDTTNIIRKLNAIAAKYPAKEGETQAVLPDFHSFKQALNIASADQRLLVYAVAPKASRNLVRKNIQQVANHPDAVGRYHYDIADTPDAKWSDVVSGDQNKTGIFIIRSNEFGQDGKVVDKLPLFSRPTAILNTLTKANKKFATSETRKVYSEHVKKGRRTGVKYNDNMPWGEDRDGDGKIDAPRKKRPERGRRQRP